jgi:hypothetical protein
MSWGILTRLGATVAVGLMVVGCESVSSIQGNQAKVFSAADENSAARNYSTANAIDDYFGTLNKIQKEQGPERVRAVTESQKKDLRDRVITLRMNAINANYSVFVTDLRAEKVSVGLAADAGTALLGLLTTVVGGAATKAGLGAGTAALAGARGAFDKNLFYERALSAVIAQMDAQRATVTKAIFEGMKFGVDRYPLAFALDDLGRLERAGSVESAVAGLTEEAKAGAKNAEKEVDRVKILTKDETLALKQSSATIDELQEKIKTIKADRAKEIVSMDLSGRFGSAWPTMQTNAKHIRVDQQGASELDINKAILHHWIAITSPENLSAWSELLK